MRTYAADALAEVLETEKNTKIVQPLIDALDDEHEWVRRSAAHALGKTGDARVVEPLISALEDEDEIVRHSATVALGRTRDSRAIAALIALLEGEDQRARLNAESVLAEVAGKHLGHEPAQWRQWWESNRGKFQSGG